MWIDHILFIHHPLMDIWGASTFLLLLMWLYLFIYFLPHGVACGILVPRPGVEPRESTES